MNEAHLTETKAAKPKTGKRDGEAFKKEKLLLEGTMIDQWIQEHYGSEEILGREGLLAKLTKAVVERALGAELTHPGLCAWGRAGRGGGQLPQWDQCQDADRGRRGSDDCGAAGSAQHV